MKCAWCDTEKGVTTVNVRKGKRPLWVEACPEHMRMVHANIEAERARREAAKAARLGPVG